MPKGDVETFHEGGKWYNRIEGAVSPETTIHLTKAVAESVGREMARESKAEHIIRNKDGKIAERNSYGQDPRSIKG